MLCSQSRIENTGEGERVRANALPRSCSPTHVNDDAVAMDGAPLFRGNQSIGVDEGLSATIGSAMRKLSRREFLMTATAATLASASSTFAAPGTQRVFVASGKPDGILSYDWNPTSGELTAA